MIFGREIWACSFDVFPPCIFFAFAFAKFSLSVIAIDKGTEFVINRPIIVIVIGSIELRALIDMIVITECRFTGLDLLK